MKNCVVFDIDDTLYLEREYVLSGFTAVGAWIRNRYEEDRFAKIAWKLFLDGHRDNVFNLVLQELELPETIEIVSEMVEVYREHQPSITLLPDVRQCLDELRGAVFLGVISDGWPVSQRRKSEALALYQRMDKLIFTAELGPHFQKPHARAFEEIQCLFNVGSSACTYVADNPEKDFLAPNRLGWNTVRVMRQGGLYSHVDKKGDYRAKHTVASLNECKMADFSF